MSNARCWCRGCSRPATKMWRIGKNDYRPVCAECHRRLCTQNYRVNCALKDAHRVAR